jgi:biotin transporter BioY
MMLVAGGFLVAWLGLAFWVRARQRAASQSPPPLWLRRLLVCVSVVYLLGVFVLVIG